MITKMDPSPSHAWEGWEIWGN